jgi:hypothetical protein
MELPMQNLQDSSADIKMLVGIVIAAEYVQQAQDREAANANEYEPLTCYFCQSEIQPDQPVNLHHPTYKSNGGTQVEPAHEKCHVEYHSRQGDFREFGKRSAMTRRWAFNLKNVRTNPAYDFDRAYYLMLYAR